MPATGPTVVARDSGKQRPTRHRNTLDDVDLVVGNEWAAPNVTERSAPLARSESTVWRLARAFGSDPEEVVSGVRSSPGAECGGLRRRRAP